MIATCKGAAAKDIGLLNSSGKETSEDEWRGPSVHYRSIFHSRSMAILIKERRGGNGNSGKEKQHEAPS